MKLEDYKKRGIKIIKLPSGLEVKVKPLNPYVLLKVQDELKDIRDDENFYSSALVEKLFQAYLVEPRVPDDIKIEEFTKEDYAKLHELVFADVTFPVTEEE